MLNFICGEVVDVFENTVILKNGGIGFELRVSGFTARQCKVGQTVQLFCHLHVRDDGFVLFGFADSAEKSMFLRLVSVSGVAGRTALAILSGISPNDLALSIYAGDTKSLTKIKGLGKKTAERLVLELKEKVAIDAFQRTQSSTSSESGVVFTKEMQEAVSILTSLGLQVADAEKRIEAASELGATTTEDLINTAFRLT